ncbi:OmpA family protein [Acetobacter farinalis]|uniref:OmpA family protein n=1 Tax=Acetobacter farinalis TaxID=1260984 RepID=UPI0019E95220|nr:OmpA family protein [Acetobacter farinalis]NHO29679.1 OmpA family protein [Acetobacter farinalis]
MQSSHPRLRRLTGLCALLLLPATAAHAQVVTNSEALDSLGSSPAPTAPAATPHPAAHRPAQAPRRVIPKPVTEPPLTHPVTQPPAESGGQTATAAPSGGAAAPHQSGAVSGTGAKPQAASPARPAHPAPPPTIPPAAPPVPQLTPAPPDVELHPFPIPPQPAVEEKATGTVTPIPGGVRITFAAGAATLNPATHQALLAFGQALADKPHVRAMVDAYSSGAADDPSMPRRMALSRGLAARSVLMNGGIPSTRIYLRVVGLPKTPAADGVQDYMDIYQSDAVP